VAINHVFEAGSERECCNKDDITVARKHAQGFFMAMAGLLHKNSTAPGINKALALECISVNAEQCRPSMTPAAGEMQLRGPGHAECNDGVRSLSFEKRSARSSYASSGLSG